MQNQELFTIMTVLAPHLDAQTRLAARCACRAFAMVFPHGRRVVSFGFAYRDDLSWLLDFCFGGCGLFHPSSEGSKHFDCLVDGFCGTPPPRPSPF